MFCSFFSCILELWKLQRTRVKARDSEFGGGLWMWKNSKQRSTMVIVMSDVPIMHHTISSGRDTAVS
jgi:hypothetical protein